jgi:chromosome segregation ATPase
VLPEEQDNPCCATLKMKRIDILVASSEDVQKERSVAEQSIRWIAAESGVPVSISDRLGGPTQESDPGPESESQKDGFLLCLDFREHQDSKAGPESCEHFLNPGQYDLVINILWTRLGIRSAPMFVLPDGNPPGSATEYEIAWVLDQSKRTPGFPGLHVYRNRTTPDAPLEPKEKREELCRHWDAVQEFCTAWEQTDASGFRECCHEYQDLEEFEDSFREHFRDFLTRQLDCQTGLGKPLRKARSQESNPFRGLSLFDFEHAAFYHGRTKAVWEVLDALKKQATAKKRFVLVMGPTGSGKSSLVRAGVLPFLTQGATALGKGPWRYAVTRPGSAGDPFDPLAAALLGKFALPELQDEESSIEWRNLASRLRKDPKGAAARIAAALDQFTGQKLIHLETDWLPAKGGNGVEVVPQKSLERINPKLHFALVVDQLEELFARGVSPVLQRKYVAALGALANCEGVVVIATLRSGFYGDFQQFPELVELTDLSGKYELQPPTPRGFGNIVRLRAGAAGLRFERDPDTGRSLDDALVEAAIASSEPLPLLEHLLSRLYQRPRDGKDGLLLWSDYRALGELQNALAQHEKTVFSTLKANEQQALRFVIRHLVAPGRGEEDHLIRRTVPYRELVSSPELNQVQRAGAIGLVDRLLEEGLLRADADPKQELLISLPQEALLRRWPGVWQWLSEDRHFFEMRDRLDASLKLWLEKGRHTDDLLDRGIGLAEAATLLRDFRSSLSEGQIEYIRKSLAKQKRRRWVRDSIGVTAIAGLAGFAAFAGIGRFHAKSQHKNEEVQLAQQNADFVASQRNAFETQLKKAEEKAQLAQQNADLAANQRNTLETELKKAQDEKTQLAQQNANLTSQSSALETELKKAREDKAQAAQQNTDLATTDRSALETELKKAQDEKTQLAQQNANLTSQSSALETQLKKTEENVQQAQQNADLAANQRSTLETELKKAQDEKTQLAQQNANLASQSSALETQLKKAEEKAQVAQQNTDVATSQSSALETKLKKAEEKAQLAQQNADLAATQRSALETELKKAREEKQQLAQQNVDLSASQRSALEAQLKTAEEKVQLVQKNADVAANQRSALETELKKAREEKAQLAQQNDNLTSQNSSLETQLKKAEEKLQQTQQNADLATSQRSALETELKKAREEKAQLTKQNADVTAIQRSNLETQLKKAEEKLQQTQQNADLAISQRNALETELKKVRAEKTQLEPQNVDLSTGQRSALEAQLKKAEEMVQQMQQNADVATSQRNALEAELEKTREEKTQLELQNADLTSRERSASETQVEKAKGKGQQQTDLANHKRKAQQTRLKKATSKSTPKSRTKKRHSTSAEAR